MPAVAVNSMLDLIGGTPLVRLRHLVEPGMADVFCKCEQFNPGGSVKDRVALSMIEAGERAGHLRPGHSVIVEPTSGNTGVGLALVSAAKRYRLILTMPDNMSLERRALLAAYGAEVYLTPAAEVMTGAVRKANELCTEHPEYFMPQQFSNQANVEAHVRTTGPEIIAQLGARTCDAFIAGVGYRRDRLRGRAGPARHATRAPASSPLSPRRAPSCRAAARPLTASTASARASCRRSWIAPSSPRSAPSARRTPSA